VVPEVVEATLAFARDAYRDGHRDLAWKAIEPYCAALRAGIALPDLKASFVSIESMRTSMLNNLDYYGNPPGWVPRLRASTNLDTFQQTGKVAARLLYYGQAAERKYTSLENADELANAARGALEEELTFRANELPLPTIPSMTHRTGSNMGWG
jgi:hypothetical protein